MGHKLLETKHSVFHAVHHIKKQKLDSKLKNWVQRERVTNFRVQNNLARKKVVGERILKKL